VSKNLLVIQIDDLNAWAVAKELYPGLLRTPNLDALMAQGTLFADACAQTANCNPSRVSTLTGLTPYHSGVFDNGASYFDETHGDPGRMIYSVLKDHGYRVGAFGKILCPPTSNSVDGGISQQLFDSYASDTSFWNHVTSKSHPFDYGGLAITESVHGDYINATNAINFIDEAARRDEPWTAVFGPYKPHSPWIVPQAYLDLYPLADVALPATQAGDLSDLPAIALKLIGNPAIYPQVIASSEWPKIMQAFLACVTFMDAMVGRVISSLDQIDRSGRPLRATTSIVVWSDNGYHMGEKQLFAKTTLWEEAARVPMIIVDPDHGTPGQVVDRPVSLLDLFPTQLDLLGISKADAPWLDGVSLVPLLDDPADDVGLGYAVTSVYGNLSVRSAGWRYMRYEDGAEELYDLSQDPHEFTNLADSTTPRALAAKAELQAHLHDYAESNHIIMFEGPGGSIIGTAQAEILVCGAAATAAGGDGNDRYFILSPATRVMERAGEGRDLIVSSIDCVLPDHVENGLLEEKFGNLDLTGNALDNTLGGNPGSNHLRGGGGDDTIDGNLGNDTIDGGRGNDVLQGGAGTDLVSGGDGDDWLKIGFGEDTGRGDAGNDTLFGSTVSRLLLDGGPGDDWLVGGFAADTLTGGAGSDTLDGGLGVDHLNGGGGRDLFVLTPNTAADTVVDFADGDDRILVLGFPIGFGGVQLAQAGPDVRVSAGANSLTLLGVAIGDISRDDFIFGGRGDAGANTLDGSGADDTIDGGGGGDVIAGQAGQDVLIGNRGNDALFGGDGNDALWGSHGKDTLDGGTGSDSTGSDTLSGGNGDDVYMVSNGNVELIEAEGEGFDRALSSINYVLPDNVEALVLLSSGGAIGGHGNSTDNTLRGNRFDNRLMGLAGNDRVDAGRGADLVEGGPGDDTLRGGRGRDSIDAGSGDDTVEGDLGADLIVGGLGGDHLSGGRGEDVFVYETAADSSARHGHHDVIIDFNSGRDKIDLSFGDFNYIGRAGFSAKGEAEVRFDRGAGIVADLDGDGRADMIIEIDLSDIRDSELAGDLILI
jgi:arylsulfatase A-like enzyme